MNRTPLHHSTPAVFALFALLAMLYIVPAARAEAVTTQDAAWVVRMNLAKLWASPGGEIFQERAREKHPEMDQRLDALAEAVGLDIRKDIGEVVMYGQGYDGDVTLIAQLDDTTGNLEGFALTAPGYESKELEGGLILHSFLVDDHARRGAMGSRGMRGSREEDERWGKGRGEDRGERGDWGDRGDRGDRDDHGGDRKGRDGDNDEFGRMGVRPIPMMMHRGRPVRRVYVTLPKAGDRFLAVASYDRDTAVAMSQDGAATTAMGEPLEGDVVMSLVVNEMPRDAAMRARPGSALLRSLEHAEMTVASGDRFRIDIALTADSQLRAEQVMQILSGLKAMVAMADENDGKTRVVAELVQAMKFGRDAEVPRVKMELDWSQKQLADWVARAEAAERGGEGDRNRE